MRKEKSFGLLSPNDVFLFDGVAYQKQDAHTAFSPRMRQQRTFSLTTIVTLVGYGIWPMDDPLDSLEPPS